MCIHTRKFAYSHSCNGEDILLLLYNILPANPLKYGFIRIEVNTYQGRSHDSSSGQVEFVPSLSDLDFSIEAIEIFSHGYFEYRTLVAS